MENRLMADRWIKAQEILNKYLGVPGSTLNMKEMTVNKTRVLSERADIPVYVSPTS